MLDADLQAVVSGSEVLVIGSSNRDVLEAVARVARPDQTMIDLVCLPANVAMPATVVGLSW